jgi:glucuronoarabinoxylan endo-1,4-beta-xylanase
MITGLAKADWGICDEENAEERKGVGDNMPKSNKLVLFPNPAKDLLFVDFKGQTSNFNIVSTVGTVVKQGYLVHGRNQVGTSQLSPGLYYFMVEGRETPVKFSILK